MTFSHKIDDPEIEALLAGIGASSNGQAGPQQEWTDPKPLPSTLLPVKPFDPDLLPGTVASWAQDIADRMQCPLDYVAIPVMVALGSIIGRRIGIRPQARTDRTSTRYAKGVPPVSAAIGIVCARISGKWP